MDSSKNRNSQWQSSLEREVEGISGDVKDSNFYLSVHKAGLEDVDK